MADEFVVNADLDKIYTNREFPLGAKYMDENGWVYRFIKCNVGDEGMTAMTAGHLAVGLDSAYPEFEGTTDMDSSTIPAIQNRPLGFVQAALTSGAYGWAQIKGKNRTAILTGGGVDSQGELIMPHATTTGAVDTHDAAAKTPVGRALEVDTSTALAIGYVDIDIP